MLALRWCGRARAHHAVSGPLTNSALCVPRTHPRLGLAKWVRVRERHAASAATGGRTPLPTAHFRLRARPPPRAVVAAAASDAAPPHTTDDAAPATSTTAVAADASASVQAAAAPVKQPVKRKVQPQDFTTLVAAVEEIRRDWTPAKIETVVQTDVHTLVLGLRTMTRSGHLYLCWHPNAARVCMGRPPERKPDADTFSYGEVMRKLIKGLALCDLVMAPWERVVQLRLAARPVDPPTRTVVVEVMGRHSNVITVNGDGDILSCAYQTGQAQTRVRPLSVGGAYTLPPVADGIQPTLEEPQPQWTSNVLQAAATSRDGTVRSGLMRAYLCVSPALANELCACAQVDPNGEAIALSGDRWAGLHVQWLRWLELVIGEKGDFAVGGMREEAMFGQAAGYTVLWDETVQAYAGAGTVAADGYGVTAAELGAAAAAGDELDVDAALRDMAKDGFAGEGGLREVSPMNAALDDYFYALNTKEKFTQLHQVLLTKVKNRLKKVADKVKDFEKKMGSAEDFHKPKELADLVMANAHNYKSRADSMTVEDFSGEGTLVTIPIDPMKGAVLTAQALYKRSGKLKRSSAAIAPLLEAAREELQYLEQMEVTVEQAEILGDDHNDMRMLEDVRAELVAARYMRGSAAQALVDAKRSGGGKKGKAANTTKGKGKGKQGGKQPEGKRGAAARAAAQMTGVRTFTAPSGSTVLVGRNNRGNETLTHDIASNHDLWFHVRGIPGSHTVLRLQPGQEAADADVQFAANLSCFFSKARNSTETVVDYTSPKHISRARGGYLGMVSIKQGSSVYTIWARPGDVSEVAEASAQP